MNRCARLIRISVSCCGFALAATVVGACKAHAPAERTTAAVARLNVSCEPHDNGLNCRATEHAADDAADPSRDADVTDVVEWTTSNVNTASILRGRVTAREPGTATIAASMRSGGETVSASVLVVVDSERTCPQVAYDLKGVVRDLSNSGITEVELTLADARGHARATLTRDANRSADGAFRFTPVLSGQYRLRATKRGYRPVERLVNVPDAMPLTLVMLPEPR